MASALTNGISIVHNVLMSSDIICTINVLTSIGARFIPIDCADNKIYTDNQGQNKQANILKPIQSFKVLGINTPSPSSFLSSPKNNHALGQELIACDMQESGTSCRLLTAILSSCRGNFRLFGSERLEQRPMSPLTNALQELGVKIIFEKETGYLPFQLYDSNFCKEEITIDCDLSSQYLSALLLIAPKLPQGLTITLGGEKAISWPYVGLTLQTLADFGINFWVEQKDNTDRANTNKSKSLWQKVAWQDIQDAIPQQIRFYIQASTYQTGIYSVEGDWSGASYLLAAGVLGQKPLMVQGLNINSQQGDKYILQILQDMGARWEINSEGVYVYPSNLKAINIDMAYCPDLVPTVAVLMACAEGISTIYNCKHLRLKESDRLQAMALELNRAGVRVEEKADGLVIYGLGELPPNVSNIKFSVHNDHRIAMSLALFMLSGQKIKLDDVEVVKKSFPHFWALWNDLEKA